MKNLYEWVDKDGNKVTLPRRASSASSGNTSSGGFKKRLEKLTEYIKTHKQTPEVEDIKITKLSDDTIKFTVCYKAGVEIFYEIYVGATTEAWRLKVYDNEEDEEPTEDISGMEWPKLLKLLANGYFNLPTVGTPEYKELLQEAVLKEFVDAKGNKVTLPRRVATSAPKITNASTKKTTKEKFEELVAYMEKYKVPYTTKTEVLLLNDICLKYKIYRKSPGIKEYTIILALHHSKFLDSWQFTVYKNGDYLDDATGNGWEELIEALKTSEFGIYATIPKRGTPVYNFLCESVSLQEFVDRNGNKVTLPNKTSTSSNNPAKNYPDQTDKFKKLLDKVAAGGRKYQIKDLRDRVLFFTTNTSNGPVAIRILLRTIDLSYLVQVIGDTDFNCSTWKEVLKLLVSLGVISNYTNCEALETSVADDFKLYENLWD